MSLIDDVKRDREAGTDGPWGHSLVGKSKTPSETSIENDKGRIVCSTGGYTDGQEHTPSENAANANRIARVPDLEAALLAADEHARASDNRLGKWMSAALSDPDVCEKMKSDINAWFSTLSTYRNAVEDAA